MKKKKTKRTSSFFLGVEKKIVVPESNLQVFVDQALFGEKLTFEGVVAQDFG